MCNGCIHASAHPLGFVEDLMKFWTYLRPRNVRFSYNTLSLHLHYALLLCCIPYLASFPGSPQKTEGFYFSLERGESLGTRLYPTVAVEAIMTSSFFKISGSWGVGGTLSITGEIPVPPPTLPSHFNTTVHGG